MANFFQVGDNTIYDNDAVTQATYLPVTANNKVSRIEVKLTSGGFKAVGATADAIWKNLQDASVLEIATAKGGEEAVVTIKEPKK